MKRISAKHTSGAGSACVTSIPCNPKKEAIITRHTPNLQIAFNQSRPSQVWSIAHGTLPSFPLTFQEPWVRELDPLRLSDSTAIHGLPAPCAKQDPNQITHFDQPLCNHESSDVHQSSHCCWSGRCRSKWQGARQSWGRPSGCQWGLQNGCKIPEDGCCG